uniref:Uncharacterized protein n=1 Tax=Brassica oleracea var. oleracea TaxID=109376 RepID=A0A0D3EH38_BRAOL
MHLSFCKQTSNDAQKIISALTSKTTVITSSHHNSNPSYYLSNLSLVSHHCLASPAPPRPLGAVAGAPLFISVSLCSLNLQLWSVKSLFGSFPWWVLLGSTMREAPSSSASGRLPLSVARGWVRSGTCRGSRV